MQLLRTFQTKSIKIWSNLYKTYVLPIVEYASEVWNPLDKANITKLEKVQRFFTRKAFIKCGKKYEPYENRLKFFNLQSLEIRRKMKDLILVFKICKGYTHFNPKDISTFSERPSRKHSLQIKIKHKNNDSKKFLINRTSNLWNNLPQNLIINNSVKLFKLQLEKYLLEEASRTLY